MGTLAAFGSHATGPDSSCASRFRHGNSDPAGLGCGTRSRDRGVLRRHGLQHRRHVELALRPAGHPARRPPLTRTHLSADDFKRVLQTLTSASAGQWGIGSYQGIAFNIAGFAQIFGAPNNWRLDAAGHLLKDRETPEYREAVGFARDLVASGVFHPDSRSITDLAAYGDAFVAGKFVLAYQGFGPTWQQQWLRGARLTPPFLPAPLGLFAAQTGGTATHCLNTGFFEAAGLKKASAERIPELLGVLDWLAAPFGSAEDLLLTHGVIEDDYTLDEAGHPVPAASRIPCSASIPRPTVRAVPCCT
jgi:putative aldouronate transport system substrate-binding protein